MDAQSSNELQKLDYMTMCRDSIPNNCHQTSHIKMSIISLEPMNMCCPPIFSWWLGQVIDSFSFAGIHSPDLIYLWQILAAMDILIFMVQGPEHSRDVAPISWLRMPWLYASPGHQQLCVVTIYALDFHQEGFQLPMPIHISSQTIEHV